MKLCLEILRDFLHSFLKFTGVFCFLLGSFLLIFAREGEGIVFFGFLLVGAGLVDIVLRALSAMLQGSVDIVQSSRKKRRRRNKSI